MPLAVSRQRLLQRLQLRSKGLWTVPFLRGVCLCARACVCVKEGEPARDPVTESVYYEDSRPLHTKSESLDLLPE